MPAMSRQHYRKHFVPLESNPDVFTHLIHTLGVSPRLEFRDVLSLEEPDLLPHPTLALILIFPTPANYEARKAKEDALYNDYTGCGEAEDVVWFKQTINNACGLYGILHAICNGPARSYIQPDSLLASLLQSCLPLRPEDRGLLLESSQELELAYSLAAAQGDTAAPTDAEADVDYHYVCFAESHINGHIYELDGDRKGPIVRGVVLKPDEDMLAEGGLTIVTEFMESARREVERGEPGEDVAFNLMALVRTADHQ